MRRELTATLLVWAMLVSACGRIDQKQNLMSADESMKILSATPRGYSAKSASYQDVQDAVQELVDSGKIQVSDANRTAIIFGKTSVLNTLFNLLSANPGNMDAVAQGMTAMTSGTNSALALIDKVAAILTAALPFVSVFAPPVAVVITAVLGVLPVIRSILAAIVRPTPTPA